LTSTSSNTGGTAAVEGQQRRLTLSATTRPSCWGAAMAGACTSAAGGTAGVAAGVATGAAPGGGTSAPGSWAAPVALISNDVASTNDMDERRHRAAAPPHTFVRMTIDPPVS
jgi:hypothetical protein